jgi:hypothetical protein
MPVMYTLHDNIIGSFVSDSSVDSVSVGSKTLVLSGIVCAFASDDILNFARCI